MTYDRSAAALFTEILRNDRIDLAARLPDVIDFHFTPDQFARCFRVSRILWQASLERNVLVQMARTLIRTGEITPGDQLRFKHERARFKHLRFAFATFGARHRYPLAIDAITSVMGNLQDAFKNGKQASARRNAALLCALLHPLPFGLAVRETARFRAATADSFRRNLAQQADDLSRFLEEQQVTAKSFHDTRKIVSSARAGFATLTTLYPTANSKSVAAFLATVNGLMGNFHDTLMSAHLGGRLDYHRDRFALQPEIRQRLQSLALALH